ncbi:MAG: hypothetical protein HRT67_12345, partial [Flavobacteriaceae bacterium]|nr:hypothetical protein [Flavobacteriaceae bacterium]
MQRFIYSLGLFFMGLFLVAGQTQTENYVRTTAYQLPVQSETAANDLPADDKLESITYYDGLGRPMQSISKQSGGQRQDIIMPVVYDGFGRESKKYLPYAREMNSLNIAYDILPDQSGDIATINSFYLDKFPEDLDPIIPNPYSETIFEDSPLNRVLEQAAPGDDWKNKLLSNINSYDHTIKFVYEANSLNPEGGFSDLDSDGNYYDNVKLYSVLHPNDNKEATALNFEGFYAEGELIKTVTKDENFVQQYTSSEGGGIIQAITPIRTVDHTTEEFKDKQGRVILKRTYNDGIAHDTQYVYDDFGNLTYVLSPKGSDLVLLEVSLIGNTTPFNYSDLRNSYLRSFNGSGG